MKTLNKIALSVSMLLSIPAFAAEGFFVKAANKAQGFAKSAKTKVVNGYETIQPKVVNGFNSAKDTVKAHPYVSGFTTVAAVAVPVVGYKLYKAYVAKNESAAKAIAKAKAEATAQVQAKAELLTAVQNNQNATVAFNKLNDANKAVVQAAFNAYNVAQANVNNAPTPKMKRRADVDFNTAKTAFINAINTIKIEQVEETKTTAKDKAKALYVTAKAKTKSAFATTKEFAKLAFAKVKEHKKKAIAATLAAALAAYEGINYKWFKKNPATLTRGFQKAKAAWNKRKRNDEIMLDGVADLFSTNKMGGYSEGTQE